MRSDLWLGVTCNGNNVYLSMTTAAAMLRARRIADYITAQKTACAAGVRGRGGEWGGGSLYDLGLGRTAAKVSAQRYTTIIHAPTSLPAHTYYYYVTRSSLDNQQHPRRYFLTTNKLRYVLLASRGEQFSPEANLETQTSHIFTPFQCFVERDVISETGSLLLIDSFCWWIWYVVILFCDRVLGLH